MAHRSTSTFRMALALAALLLARPGAAAPGPKCTAQEGQMLIDQGRYKDAVREFSCLIDTQPTGFEGYRGRIEALLLLGRYSDALRDYVRVTAFVEPVDPDAESAIVAGYAARLDANPSSVSALTGLGFAYWYFFDYPAAIHVLDRLLDVRPHDLFGTLFRGSSRVLHGSQKAAGAADLEHAIGLAPASPDVRFIVADAYTYGDPDPERALFEALLALEWGLDTPRVHAILASAYLALGDLAASAIHVERHIDLVTSQLVAAPVLSAGYSLELNVVPGRTWEIPVPAVAGQTISILTDSGDFVDTILVLLAPDGSPVLGSDDYRGYFAGFEWVAETTGTYFVHVTSFEAASTGVLSVTRD